MTRKEAFLRKGETAFKFCGISIYNRANIERWYEDYNVYQMNYLWDYDYIEFSKPIVNLGESPNQKFVQFTKSGLRWREWYTMSHWDWIKYNVLGKMFWLYKVWYPLRKFIFRKPCPWEGYSVL